MHKTHFTSVDGSETWFVTSLSPNFLVVKHDVNEFKYIIIISKSQ
jgi:hypothetical protein